MNEAGSQDECDVFLVHSNYSDDIRKAEYIYTILERNNLSCVPSAIGQIGKPLLEGTVYMIEHSVKTLVLVTLESFKIPWLKLDLILALENAVHSRKACVRLLVEGDQREEFKELGLLGSVPYLSVDFNRSDWEEKLLEEVQKDPEIMDNPLPAGNLALGQVYSVVVGYYGTVLPCLSKILTENQTVKQNLSTTSTRFFILIPSDCKILNPLTQCRDSRIERVDVRLCVKTEDYCGKERTYFVTLYKITDGSTVYYFVGEIPYVLNTISMLHAKGSIVEVDRSYEVNRFLWTLESVLTHRKHDDCKDTFHVIKFEPQLLVDTILTQIKKDVTPGLNAKCVMTPQAKLDNSVKGQSYEFDAAIVYDDEVSTDQMIAQNISDALCKNNFTFSFEEPGKPKLEFLDKARWKIIILSKESRLRPICCFALASSINNDKDKDENKDKEESTNKVKAKVRVIPVLNGIMVKEIPQFMYWMSCIYTNENYIDSLLNIMTGQELELDHCLPRGNVYTGLVWGYILNYLPIPLIGKALGSDIQPVGADLTNRIKMTLRDKSITCGCMRKLYLCIPKSCEDRKLDDADGIAKIGELEAVKVAERVYRLAMYMMTSPDLPDGQVCFLAEQPAPTKHLFDISKRYRNVGISEIDLHSQAEEFCKSCTANVRSETFIRDVGDLNSLCQFLFYDAVVRNVLCQTLYYNCVKHLRCAPTE
ncbi:hypothetical protein ACJMK2_019039 [Sinanodonta woodiana]|uniref:STING ligand-binding domain-containing protein n=1 Tax=Sinanodonta woodiana TaxID=1069815 RepID=A0ABD3UFJ1_SINWO